MRNVVEIYQFAMLNFKVRQGFQKKMIKVPQQITTSYDRIANERLVYTVIYQ